MTKFPTEIQYRRDCDYVEVSTVDSLRSRHGLARTDSDSKAKGQEPGVLGCVLDHATRASKTPEEKEAEWQAFKQLLRDAEFKRAMRSNLRDRIFGEKPPPKPSSLRTKILGDAV